MSPIPPGRARSIAGRTPTNIWAIKAKDAEQAEVAMRDHIREIEEVVTKTKTAKTENSPVQATGATT
ncbi:hypothetical protein ACVWY0_002483 [Arthrobacter sp. UYNi723]